MNCLAAWYAGVFEAAPCPPIISPMPVEHRGVSTTSSRLAPIMRQTKPYGHMEYLFAKLHHALQRATATGDDDSRMRATPQDRYDAIRPAPGNRAPLRAVRLLPPASAWKAGGAPVAHARHLNHIRADRPGCAKHSHNGI